jgi:hypothetical protein
MGASRLAPLSSIAERTARVVATIHLGGELVGQAFGVSPLAPRGVPTASLSSGHRVEPVVDHHIPAVALPCHVLLHRRSPSGLAHVANPVEGSVEAHRNRAALPNHLLRLVDEPVEEADVAASTRPAAITGWLLGAIQPAIADASVERCPPRYSDADERRQFFRHIGAVSPAPRRGVTGRTRHYPPAAAIAAVGRPTNLLIDYSCAYPRDRGIKMTVIAHDIVRGVSQEQYDAVRGGVPLAGGKCRSAGSLT